MEPHGALLRDRDPSAVWNERLSATFDALVQVPVFEDLARTWVRRYASLETARTLAILADRLAEMRGIV